MPKMNRYFIVLLTSTLGMVLLAWLLVSQENDRLAEKNFTPFLFYGELIDHSDEIKIMQLEIGRGLSGVQKITLWRNEGEKFFRIYQAGDFFAKQSITNRLLYGVASLRAEGMRGNQLEQLEKLGLVAPEKLGPAIRITFYRFKPKNKKMLSLLVGNRPEKLEDVLGQFSIYVRPEKVPGGLIVPTMNNASFLARGSLPLRTDVKEWVDLDFFRLWLNEPIDGRAFRLAKVQFSLRGKAGWVLRRLNEQGDFNLFDRRGIPLRGVYDSKRIALIEKNLTQLRFSAVRPSADINFKRADIVIFESFSGLAVIFEVVQNNTGFWAKITTRATSAKAQALAKKLSHHLEGFAFRLPREAARRVVVKPEQLKKKRSRRPRTPSRTPSRQTPPRTPSRQK